MKFGNYAAGGIVSNEICITFILIYRCNSLKHCIHLNN